MPQIAEMESELMLPQAYAERGDLRDRLNRIIDGLSAVQRETIVLYYFSDRSIAEIAEIMDCSENTVKSRLYLARNSIRTEIEEQERKSGEKFYGIAIGALPIGYFVTEHIKHCLPSSELLGNLVSSAQQAGQSAASQAANGASVSGKVGSAAAKTAVKGMPTAVKAVIATVGIAAVAASGVMTARLITNGQQDDDITPVETQAIVETAAPTAAPTKAPTEAPTEPDYTDAYRAYLEVLENNKSDIKAYDWQLGDDESRPIAFADIAGDGTPEMIFTTCDPEDEYKSFAYLRIYQYSDGEAKCVYSQTRDDELIWLDFTPLKGVAYPGTSQYVLYQLPGEKTLYHYDCGGRGLSDYEVVRSYGDSGEGISMKTNVFSIEYQQNTGNDTYEINSSSVSKSEASEKITELTESSANVLMCNSPQSTKELFSTLRSRHDNQAMTYDEAITFLNEKTGNDATKSTDSPNFSVIAGEYHYLKVFGSNESDIIIGRDGSFYHHSYNFNGMPMYDSACNGRVISVEQDNNISTKYTFKIADQELEHSSGDNGTRTQGGREVTYEYNDSALFNKQKIFAVYLPGTSVSDLTADEYDFFKRFNDTEAPDGYLHSALLSVSNSDGSDAYLYH